MGEKMARVLQLMGSEHCLVVHGGDGQDELTLGDDTYVWELKNDNIDSYTVNPQQLGLPRVGLKALQGGTPHENAFLLRRILTGQQGFIETLSSSTAPPFWWWEERPRPEGGLALAKQVVDDGHALMKLEALVEISQSLTDDSQG